MDRWLVGEEVPDVQPEAGAGDVEEDSDGDEWCLWAGWWQSAPRRCLLRTRKQSSHNRAHSGTYGQRRLPGALYLYLDDVGRPDEYLRLMLLTLHPDGFPWSPIDYRIITGGADGLQTV